MESLTFQNRAQPAGGSKPRALVGVVASGNLEVLVERAGPAAECTVEVATPVHGFGEIWRAVIGDFCARHPAGGLRLSINDGGARPDTVALRLAQGVRLIQDEAP